VRRLLVPLPAQRKLLGFPQLPPRDTGAKRRSCPPTAVKGGHRIAPEFCAHAWLRTNAPCIA